MNRKSGVGRATATETWSCLISLVLWLLVTTLFVGFRPEHVALGVLVGGLFFASPSTRRLSVALLPFIVFAVSYDWMNLLPNYEVNPVDTSGLYNSEKMLFGIETTAGVLTPNEYFSLHNSKLMDFLAGIFYLCWVPLPVFFGLWLYFTGKKRDYLHFALVFLFVNLIGFAGYYIHPAAPPWYVALHGFEAVPGTPGSVAGLGRFDEMTGISVFHVLYERNANVFAAVPSLHSAYTLVAFIYSLRSHSSMIWRVILCVVTIGIWFTAVYSSHHYIIDVLLGISCALSGFLIFEYVLMKIPGFSRWISRYVEYIL